MKNSDIKHKSVDVNGIFENRPALLLFSFLTFIVFIVFFNFLTNRELYLFTDIGSDTSVGFFPNFYAYVSYFKLYGIPTWTFYEGMGSNVFPAFFNNPMHLLFLLFSPKSIPYVILFIAIAKLYIAGYFFYRFLDLLSWSKMASICGSLMLTFSGFMILGGTWYLFSAEGMHFAVLLFGIEYYLKRKRIIAFVVAVALIAAHQPFNLYLYSLISIIYLAARLLGDLNVSYKDFLFYLARFVVLGVLGVGLSFLIFYANLNRVMESPRVSGEASYASTLKDLPVFRLAPSSELQSIVYRFISSDLAGTGDNYTGYYNYLECPLGYMGLLTLMLFTYSFRYLNKKQKAFYIVILLLGLLASIFPYFRHLFWLFTGDYYRTFSFFVSFFLLFYTVRSIDIIFRESKVNLMPVLIHSSVILLFLFVNFEPKVVPREGVQILVLTFVIAYISIFLLMREKSTLPYLPVAFSITLVLELTIFSYITINDRGLLSTEKYNSREGYFDYTLDALDYIKSIDDTPFYRIDKEYHSGWAIHRSFLDAMGQNFFSTETYNNFNQKHYINFLAGMKVIDPRNEILTRWSFGLKGRYILQTTVNTKYRLTRRNWDEHGIFAYKFLDTIKEILIYENTNFVPFGSTYQYFIRQSDFDKLSPQQAEITALRAIVLKDSDVSRVSGIKALDLNDTLANYSSEDIAMFTDDLQKEHMQIEEFRQKYIRGNIALSSDKIMLISTPFDKGWQLKVNGVEKEILIVHYGLIGIHLPEGNHEIELKYCLRNFELTLCINVIALLLFFLLIFLKQKQRIVFI